MADLKISELATESPIVGTELVEVVTGGINKKTTTQDIANLNTASVSDTAFADSWNGVTGVAPSKNAAYDAVNPLVTSVLLPRTITDSDTLALTDTFIIANKATGLNVTIPPNSSVAFPVNKYIPVMQIGVGTVTIVAGVGVTVTSSSGVLTTPSQNSVIGLVQTAADVWRVVNGSTGDVIDWSTGITPVGWASFTVKQAYYIDDGKRITLTGQVTGTGDGTTAASFSLPVAPNSTIYATLVAAFGSSIVNNTTQAIGLVLCTGGSVTANCYPSAIVTNNWTASTARQIRFTITYFK